jgi:hypothetical protein
VHKVDFDGDSLSSRSNAPGEAKLSGVITMGGAISLAPESRVEVTGLVRRGPERDACQREKFEQPKSMGSEEGRGKSA